MPFLCYSVFQTVSSSGEISLVLMDESVQKLLCHFYSILYPREYADVEKYL